MKSSTNTPSLKNLIVELWRHLNRRRQRQFGLLFGLMLISALSEVISLGAVLPFLGILIAPEHVFNIPIVMDVAHYLGITSAEQLVLPLTLVFAVAALMAGVIRTLLLWVSTRVSYGCGADLSLDLYRRTLHQPYQVHVSRNSSEMISSITNKVNGVTFGILLSLLNLVSSVVLLVAITITLIAIDPFVASVAAIGFGACYVLITSLSRRSLHSNSLRIAHEQTQVVKALQEGLGGIRDVLLDGTQSVYCDIYRRADSPLRRAHGNNMFISQYPRFGMETLGMILIASLAYYLSRDEGGVASALPVLGALAFGAQRLLPAFHQIYSSWASIAGTQASLRDTIELLDQPLPTFKFQHSNEKCRFVRDICFNEVSFRYRKEGPWVLKEITFSISKGMRIGFVGLTGSGKSTILDLLMGLLEPTEGQILIDNNLMKDDIRRAWQKNIAHVPQNIFLADTSLAENIAFGIPFENIDMERVKKAAHQAQIGEFIESSPEGYMAFVGERGIRLSGGQRQRIGIARALYKQATVLVFDEATSALDNATEKSVMDAISKFNRDLTIVIIAHRLTTVKRCDTIVELGNGIVIAQGSYEELLESSKSFHEMAFASE
jgi:ABC-type multidrug transport system fused ATPase/permease subunit